MRRLAGFVSFMLVLAFAVSARVAAGDAPGIAPADSMLALRILGTGEIHATPDSCDCPLNPVGGLGRLAGLLKAEVAKAPGRTILIDTGAWAAGGPLDSRSAGAAQNLERSRLMAQFMYQSPYAAVALGDEELSLGRRFFGLPVLPGNAGNQGVNEYNPRYTCANLNLTDDERFVTKIAVIQAVNSAWVVGLAPPGDYGTGDDAFHATDPEPVLRALIAKAAADPAQPKIILASHLGDAATELLLAALVKKPVLDAAGKPIDSGIIIAVLAGHHRPAEVRQSIANTPVLYVRGEGQYVSVIEFTQGGGFPRLRELAVDANAPVDSAAAKLADQIRALISTARPQIDVTFATDCPHCITALAPVMNIIARLKVPAPLADVQLRFMVHRLDDGRWITGIQPGLAAETKSYEATRRLLIVQKYAPDAVWPLLHWLKNNPDADFAEGLKTIQFPAWRMQGALDGHEDEPLLEENRLLTDQRHVPGTPSIYIQGKLYEGSVQELPLMSALCGVLRAHGAAEAALTEPCKGVPRCFQDGDCFKPGFISRCLDAGKPTAECKFIEDKEVTVWVVQDPQAVHSNAADLINQLGKFLAKMKVEAIDSHSAQGQQIIALSEQATLPIYAIKNLPDAVNQADVEKFGKYVGGTGNTPPGPAQSEPRLFVLEPVPWYSHDYFQRARQPGRLDVFYELHSPNAAKAILRLTATLAQLKKEYPNRPAPTLGVHPLVYLQPSDEAHLQPEQLIARGGLGELQQSALLLVVAGSYRDKALAYAQLLAETPGSIYWEAPLKAVGLDPADVAERSRAASVTVDLREEAKLAQTLRLQGDIGFLVRNQEVVPIQNGAEMYRILQALQEDLAKATTPPAPVPSPAPQKAPTP